MKPTQVLMVCLGNICRSPTAQGIFEDRVRCLGLSQFILVDSAGTSGWHIGSPPDSRSCKAALRRGYDLSQQRGRQVSVQDFHDFDYVLAMDGQNLQALKALCPEGFAGHLGLFLEFSRKQTYLEVPDPYHGGSDGFELVLDLIEEAADGLLADILAKRPEVHAQAGPAI
ncbi:MAG: low molecular weight phosphotyrosine protein phosphatase [Cellvibrionaceae bacterium]|nr:low molecular weight phosphotyrosine protein phosphatase [Cellvibrionaceae bacterium]